MRRMRYERQRKVNGSAGLRVGSEMAASQEARSLNDANDHLDMAQLRLAALLRVSPSSPSQSCHDFHIGAPRW
jgi:hypothetical protein